MVKKYIYDYEMEKVWQPTDREVTANIKDTNGGEEMLMEMLYSIVFFLLPVIGMFIAVIARALQLEEEGRKEAEPYIGRKKRGEQMGSLLVDHPIMRYQLIEGRVQMPLRFSNHKRVFHQRAGP